MVDEKKKKLKPREASYGEIFEAAGKDFGPVKQQMKVVVEKLEKDLEDLLNRRKSVKIQVAEELKQINLDLIKKRNMIKIAEKMFKEVSAEKTLRNKGKRVITPEMIDEQVKDQFPEELQ